MNILQDSITISYENSIGDAGQIGPDQNVCSGADPMPINSIAPASAAEGLTASYRWQYRMGDGEWMDHPQSANEETLTPTIEGDTTYYRRVAFAEGCETWKATEPVAIILHPEINIEINAPSSICAGEPTFIEVEGPADATYVWSTEETATTISVRPTEETNYSVTVTAAYGCTETAEVTLMVMSTEPITEETAIICAGEELTLNSTGGMNYEWRENDELIGTTASIAVSPTSDTQYELTTVSENGCVGRISYPVRVLPIIELTYTQADISCETTVGSIQLTSNSSTDGQDVEFKLSNDTYSVTDNSTTMLFDELSAGTYTLKAYYIDYAECSSTKLIEIEEEKLEVGSTCDDGDVQTEMDVIQEDGCTCRGTPRECDEIVDALFGQDTIFTATNDFETLNTDYTDSTQTEILAGKQIVAEKNFSSKAKPGTRLRLAIQDSVGTDYIPYAMAGSLEGNQVICQGEALQLITEATPVRLNQDATLIYSWQRRTPTTSWIDMQGETNATLQPTVQDSITYFRRLVQTQECGVRMPTDSVAVVMSSVEVAIESDRDTIAVGETVELRADTETGVAFEWSTDTETNETTNTYQVSPTSTTTYRVVTTNEQGCTATDEITIYIKEECNPLMELSSEEEVGISITNSCNESSITVAVNPNLGTGYTVTLEGPDGDTIDESPREDNCYSIFDKLGDGDYELVVTDEDGCKIEETISVGLAIELEEDESSCSCGGPTGSLNVNIENLDPALTLEWRKVGEDDTVIGSEQNLSGVAPGSYTLTIVNESMDCSSTSEPFEVPACTTQELMVSIAYENGVLTSSPEGGDANYTYQWSNGNYIWGLDQTNAQVTNPIPGTYQLIITDGNGCTAIGTATGSDPDSDPDPEVIVIPDCSSLAVSADVDVSDGFVTLFVDGGTGPYQYGEETIPADQGYAYAGVFEPGEDYIVTITDDNGCTAETTGFSVPDCSALAINETVTATNITVNVVDPDENSSYSYEWYDGETTATIETVAGDSYEVTVTDNATGCSVSKEYVGGEQSTEPTVTCSLIEMGDDCNYTASIMVEVANIEEDYDISYTNLSTENTMIVNMEASGAIEDQEIAFPRVGDQYQVTVNYTDGTESKELSCATTLTIRDYKEDNPEADDISITSVNPCEEGQLGSITIQVNNSVGDLGDIELTDVAGNPIKPIQDNCQYVFENLSPGTYCFMPKVDDAENVCTEKHVIDIAPPMILTSEVSRNNINVSVEGGAVPLSYLWSTGVSESNLTDLLAGTYTLTVTDANGCTAITVAEIKCTGFTVDETITSIVPGINDKGAINLNVSGGLAPYTYSWSNGATDEMLSNLDFGVYHVTVTDALVCTQTGTYIIHVLPPISPTTTIDVDLEEVLPDGLPDGTIPSSICYTIEGGDFDGTVTEEIDPPFEVPTGTGEYIIHLTDKQGNYLGSVTKDSDGNITLPEIDASATVLLPGESITLTVPEPENEEGEDTEYVFYEWTTGETGSQIDVTEGGTYAVLVTDSEGNKFSIDITITAVENCTNESDDDGDGLEPCEDLDCLLFELEMRFRRDSESQSRSMMTCSGLEISEELGNCLLEHAPYFAEMYIIGREEAIEICESINTFSNPNLVVPPPVEIENGIEICAAYPASGLTAATLPGRVMAESEYRIGHEYFPPMTIPADMSWGTSGDTSLVCNKELLTASDDELFDLMEDLMTYTSRGAYHDIVLKYIALFRNNEGREGNFPDVYEEDDLTNLLIEDSEIRDLVKTFGAELSKALIANNGETENIDNINIPIQSRPIYNGNYYRFLGPQILINDTEKFSIHLQSFDYDLATGEWKGDFCVEITDNFGLDNIDLRNFQKRAPLFDIGDGFAAWWILQHDRGYQPFLTRIKAIYSIKGTIKP